MYFDVYVLLSNTVLDTDTERREKKHLTEEAAYQLKNNVM